MPRQTDLPQRIRDNLAERHRPVSTPVLARSLGRPYRTVWFWTRALAAQGLILNVSDHAHALWVAA